MEHGFSGGAVVVGLQPGQDPAVLACAADLAAATGAELVGAYVDPGSYLIEWDPRGNVLDQSMEHALDPDDEAASALRELRPLFVAAAEGRGLRCRLQVLGGDPASALGRLAQAVSAAAIVVGARHPGLLAGVNEVLAGSVVRKLLATQHLPVLAVPRVDAHPWRHG
ncbi:universal stress protein [Arthrobacter sp. H35-D1]|uniref:universal stress protein n=1 Tax=Arthrobacter sp. H35-D1 TaxID=3046202 RepID=UPI0024B935A7|nr:universal stress protein [Arthrobacter sp. H35-D1]MDJ0314847.1 universal stress protein [Arthrobacter sp. H35-D1]